MRVAVYRFDGTADVQHTLMFGGSYKSGSLRMMKQLNSWAEGQESVDE